MTVLTGWLCAPTESRAAGCDHGTATTAADRQDQARQASGRFELLTVVDRSTDGPLAEAPVGDWPRPCSGPSCSKGEGGAPASPTAPMPAPSRAEAWSEALASPPIDGPSAPIAADERDARPARHGAGVFHPPRAA